MKINAGRVLWPTIVIAVFIAVSAVFGAARQNVAFDVNDLAYLWPVPVTQADVAELASADDLAAGSRSSIWPRAAFDILLKTARDVRVSKPLTVPSRIQFGQFEADFAVLTNWKVAAFRVDPSAPGGHSGAVERFGSTPQLRVILQPVTVQGGVVTVHDVTAHLAFSFVLPSKLPPPGFPRTPDRDLFMALLNDLKALKAASEAAGVPTKGRLSVHPALKDKVPGFGAKVKEFLRTHMLEAKLTEMAFMGLDQPEPWIFFGMAKAGGTFKLQEPIVIGKANAQMLILRGGTPVLPAPRPGNVPPVSTASLWNSVEFDGHSVRFNGDLDAPVEAVDPKTLHRDIPDVIADPERSHVLNTDCVSCHTESSLRSALSINNDGRFKYRVPDGISGVNEALLPKHLWNVRNFGWFPNFFEGGKASPSISMRTANEAAEAAALVNRNYLSIAPMLEQASRVFPQPVGTTGATDVGQSQMQTTVQNPLTLVMNIKSKEDFLELKATIEKMQGLPPEKNPIIQALNEIGTVHFARFVFLSEKQLAVITTYDGSLDTYIDAFVNVMAKIFDDILRHMADAPPLPVSQHRKEFLDYIKKHDLPSVAPFYSAYPSLRVLDILQLQHKGK